MAITPKKTNPTAVLGVNAVLVNCSEQDEVDQFVYIRMSGEAAPARTTTAATMDAFGVIAQKPTSTTAIVKIAGTLTSTGLTIAADYYIASPVFPSIVEEQPAIKSGYDGGSVQAFFFQRGNGDLLWSERSDSYYHSNDGGRTWGTGVTNTGITDRRQCAGIRMASGRLLIAAGLENVGPTSTITVNLSDDDGATWGADDTLESNPAFSYRSPTLVLASGGNAVLLWYKSPGAGIWASYSTNGNLGSWSAPVQVVASANASNPKATLNAAGEIYVTYHDSSGSGSRYFKSTAPHDGSSWTADAARDNASATEGGYQSLITVDNGDMYFFSTVSGGELKWSKSTNDGTNWTALASFSPVLNVEARYHGIVSERGESMIAIANPGTSNPEILISNSGGKISTTAPSASGEYSQKIGTAVSTTDLVLNFQPSTVVP